MKVNLSYWERAIYFDNLHLLVVGSGIVGLCSAIAYKKKFPKRKVLIVERGFLPSGASTKNAGFACFGSISELKSDFKVMQAETVWETIEMRLKGLTLLKSMLGEERLAYENCGGYEIFDEIAAFEQASDSIAMMNKQFLSAFGMHNVYSLVENNFGFANTVGIIKNHFEGALDTGKMMRSLHLLAAELGVLILNGLAVDQLHESDNGVKVLFKNNLELKTEKVLIATNGFARELLPQLQVSPNRSQVLVTKPIPHLPFKGTFHYHQGYFYFRHTPDQRILIGGGRHLDFSTEQTFEFGETNLIQNTLEELLKQMVLPETPFEVDYRWSGIMGLGTEKKPIIQSVSENVICAVKLGGMGVAIGSLVAEEAVALLKD